MIIRIATFNNEPVASREWITEAVAGLDGVFGVYHAEPIEGSGYVSITLARDEESLGRATEAIAEVRIERGIESRGPDKVTMYQVHHFTENR